MPGPLRREPDSENKHKVVYEMSFSASMVKMPCHISNAGARQTHPLYKAKHAGSSTCVLQGGSKKVDVQKEITTAIPKTYDAIKSASMGGADVSYGMKAKKK